MFSRLHPVRRVPAAAVTWLIASFAVIGASRAAEPSLDIVGIRLGMPAADALKVLQAHAADVGKQNLTMSVQPATIGFVGLPKPIVWGFSAIGTRPNRFRQETIFVVLTMPPNPQVVAEVSRSVQYPDQRLARDSIVSELQKKYGPESYPQQVDQGEHDWFFRNGRVLNFPSSFAALDTQQCRFGVGSAADGRLGDISDLIMNVLRIPLNRYFIDRCGVYIHALVPPLVPNPNLTDQFAVSIVDVAAENIALEKTRKFLTDAQEAYRQQEAQKARQAPQPQL